MPKLDKNEILVKVVYVSQNPTGTSRPPFVLRDCS